MGRDAALVFALLALGGGLLTAGQLLFCAIRSRGVTKQERGQASQNDQQLNQLHKVQGYVIAPSDKAGGRRDTDSPPWKVLL